MPLLDVGEGSTPLTPEELSDLIPNLAAREELNEWERENILRARRWALGRRNFKRSDPISDEYIRKLHDKMFDQTWKWAGCYRKTEKTIGVPVQQMREMLVTLLGDARYWIKNETYPADEIAVRFHHRLVLIHLFPNGNGRHARLIADVVAVKLGRPVFAWGGLSLIKPGEAREQYLRALGTADAGEFVPADRVCALLAESNQLVEARGVAARLDGRDARPPFCSYLFFRAGFAAGACAFSGASSSAVTKIGSMSVGIPCRRSSDFCKAGRTTPISSCSFFAPA